MEDSREQPVPVRRGELLGERYVLGDVLGVGAMGVVYAALQRSLARPVAIKVPHPRLLADPEVRARFHTEAMAGARLSHRHIVRVLELGEERGAPYLVMELVAGERLGAMLARDGRLPVLTALRLMRQLVGAIAEAHAVGVVHGDLKPDNVLVEILRDGRPLPRLIDFGLARFADEAAPARGPGERRVVSGTPDYLAPELILGGEPTFVSDVYAAGVVLYELLAGATPFAGGTSAEIMARHLDEDHAPLSDHDRTVPRAVDDVLACALAKYPGARYADGAELATALAHADAGHIDAPGPRAPAPLDAFATRRRAPTPPTLLGAGVAATDASASDPLVVSVLDAAGALIARHDYGAAIRELEAGVALLEAPARALVPAPTWRLQLLLAALYAERGDRNGALRATHAAQANAIRAHSTVGRLRAEHLLARLGPARRRT